MNQSTMTSTTKTCFFCAFLAHFALVIGLKLNNVSIPQYGWKDGAARLECEFDLESDTLLVLKWYKDDNEFYRYTPTAKPPSMAFETEGVFVDKTQSDLKYIVLKNITLKTGGTFKCEVSAERPTFKTLSKQSQMIVIAPPESEPVITGLREVVSSGDTLRGNCTSLRSKPAAFLVFYINGAKADIADTIEYSPQSDEEGLETSVLGIKLQVDSSNFKSGVMEVKCTATIGNGYWVKIKTVSDASINAQPSIPGHNRLSSGAESLHSHPLTIPIGTYGASLILNLILYGFGFYTSPFSFSFCGFLSPTTTWL